MLVCFHSFKQGNRRKPIISKGYIAVYVCFSTKAVFFDLVVDLTTEAFLASMRRFSTIYGVSADIFSDNRSNFVGANAELIRLKKLLQSDSTQQAVHQFAHEHSCRWNFNPSRALHFGGLWESAVKSMKTLLLKSTRHQTLRFDELQTLLYEAVAILNSRPLAPMETHVADGPLALTPAHFLTGRSLSFLPTDSSETIVYSYGKRWRFMQRLYNDLWKHWKEEYLVHLHRRGKWKSQQSNISPGDIVLIKDDDTFSRVWLLGRVLKVYPGPDGLVRTVDLLLHGKLIDDQLVNLFICSGKTHSCIFPSGGVCLDHWRLIGARGIHLHYTCAMRTSHEQSSIIVEH